MNIDYQNMLFPVQQIVSTSVGAIFTALLMVELYFELIESLFNVDFRRHSMLFEYECNPKIIHP